MKGCRPFVETEVENIHKRLARGRNGRRDVALFVLGIQTGFRISELLSIARGDCLREGRVVDLLTVSRARMKGKKDSRTAPLTSGTKTALGAWLAELYQRGHMQEEDFVFQSARKGNRPISRSGAWKVIHNAALACGCRGVIGTHSMRKTYAHRLYRRFKRDLAGGHEIEPLKLVSEALGHRDIASTAKYLALEEGLIRQAIMEEFD